MYEFYNKTKPANVGPASAPKESLDQQAFTKMVQHLRKQGAKSWSLKGAACAYRGGEGKMCAVGCLINDEHYLPAMDEGLMTSRNPLIRHAVAESMGGPVHDGLLEHMQYIHDAHPVEEWEVRFTDTAVRYNLTVPPMGPPA